MTRILKQKVVYWAYSGVDKYGKPKYGSPIEIKARWEDVNEQFTTPSMTVAMSLAKVYVDRDLLVNGVLWLSSKRANDPDGSAIAELTDTVKPLSNPGAHQIQRFDKLPDIKILKTLRTAYL